MANRNLTFGWYLPTHGDTTAFGKPEAALPQSLELFDEIVEATDSGGYHYMLLPVTAVCWDANMLAAYYVAKTRNMAPLIAIRAGYANPTFVAKMFATLDQIAKGRLCINLIAGIDNSAAEADGVFDDKETRYEKMDEEVQIMKRLWASDEPIGFVGKHYKVNQVVEPKPYRKPHPPFFLGGGSAQAAEISAKHSSVHLFWGDKPDVITAKIRDMKVLAAKYGRADKLQYGMRLQVICRDSEEEAWQAAYDLIAGAPRLVLQNVGGRAQDFQHIMATSEANRRVWELLEQSGNSMRIHPHLWTGVATVRAGAGISLVGTPRQIASTIEEFIEAGCTSFCLSGYPHAETARIFSEKVMRPFFGERLATDLPAV
ncbi:MAG: LLM class flavin-dependent oxidoreductase [Hyphomicrobiaceae bacterium]